MILNADQMKIEVIWEMLRGAASAAGPNTTCYTEIIEVINDMKNESAQRMLTAHKAWVMVSCLANRDLNARATTNIMTEFMNNLKRMQATQYVLVPERKEDESQLFQAENKFNWNMLTRSRLNPNPIDPGVENVSMLTAKSNDRSELVFEINSQG